jgi:hypothetical protein
MDQFIVHVTAIGTIVLGALLLDWLFANDEED